MPGIVGLIARNKTAPRKIRSQFERMMKLLHHFDSYEQHGIIEDDFAIGQIGIPHRGYRTVRKGETNGNIIVFDGFVYGWRGKSPAPEPHLAEPVSMFDLNRPETFEESFEEINGNCNYCLYDRAKDIFYIGNDRLGYRRLYYYQNDEVIAFAPEIKAFMGIDSFPREIDHDALIDMINYAFVSNKRSLFKDVTMLYPAEILTVKNRNLHGPRIYWEYNFNIPETYDIDKIARDFYDLGEDLLRRQMGDHDKFVVALSGGMDSRFLAQYAAKTDSDIHYYTHGLRRSDDARIARQVADTYGFAGKFHYAEIDPEYYALYGPMHTWLTDGMIGLYTASLISSLKRYRESPLEFEFLNSLASGNINFASAYGKKRDIMTDMSWPDKKAILESILGKDTRDQAYYDLFDPELSKRAVANWDRHIEEEFVPLEKKYDYFLQQKDVFFIYGRGMRLSNQYDLNRYFMTNHLALVDHAIVDFYNDLPMEWQIERRLYKKLFTDFAPKAARIPYQKTGVPIGAPGLSPKMKFKHRIQKLIYLSGRLSFGQVNLHDPFNFMQRDMWIRCYPANMKFFKHILLDERTKARGFFNTPAIASLIRKQARGSSNYMVLSNLATYELFFRFFIDGDEPPPLKI